MPLFGLPINLIQFFANNEIIDSGNCRKSNGGFGFLYDFTVPLQKFFFNFAPIWT